MLGEEDEHSPGIGEARAESTRILPANLHSQARPLPILLSHGVFSHRGSHIFMNKVHAHGLRLALFGILFLLILAGCGSNPSSGTGSGNGTSSNPVALNLGYYP